MADRRRQGSPGPRRAPGTDGGFTLIELMVAMTVFSVMLIGFSLLLNSSLKAYRFARARTMAETLATGELDKARQVGWANLGTLSGNPPGTLVASEDVVVGTSTLHVTRFVELVDDNIPTYGYGTGANYKRVVITVTSPAMTLPVIFETLVAPPTQPSLYSANVEASVFDTCRLGASGGVFPGATVTIQNGPSPTRSDTTNSAGVARFAALIPTNASPPGDHYDASASATGWQMLSPENPGDLHFVLDPGNTAQPQMELYKPVTVNVTLVDVLGQPVTSPYTLTVTDWRGNVAPVISGQSPTGAVSLASFGTSSFVACKSYTFVGSSLGYTTTNPLSVSMTPTDYPTTTSLDVTVQIPIPARTATTFHLIDSATGGPLAGVSGVVDDVSNPLEPDQAFTTDAAGLATLQLLPDSYTITTTGPTGYYGGSFSYTVPIPTGPPAPLDVTLAVNPFVYSVVAFTVSDPATATPLASTVVEVDGGTNGTYTFTSDAAGAATLTLPIGSYTVRVVGPPAGYQAVTSSLTVTTSTTAASVSVPQSGAVTLTTRAAGTLAIVPNVAVTISGGPSPTTTLTTGSDGTVTTYLVPGYYNVTVNPAPSGFATYTGSMMVPSGPYAHTVTLSYPPVAFNASNAVTSSAAGGVTLAYSGGPSGSGSLTVNSYGYGQVALAPGTYTVSFAGDATYQAYSGTLTVSGSSPSMTVQLWPKATVSVAFKIRKNGSSQKGWSLTLSGPTNPATFTVASGSSSTTSNSVDVMPGVYGVGSVSLPPACTVLNESSVTITTAGTYTLTCS